MPNWPTKKSESAGRVYMSTWWDVKKTEAEWAKALDGFAIVFTPEWFKFLGWMLMLGALEYIRQKSNSVFLVILYVVSLGSLYLFLQAKLFSFPFYKLFPGRFFKSQKVAFYFSIIVAAIIMWGLQSYIVRLIIKQLSIR